MPQFRYSARNSQGQLVEAVITCADRSAALAQIEGEKCFPIKIEQPSKPAGANAPAERTTVAQDQVTSLPLSHQFLFTEQLGHLLAAGMTLDEALSILEKRFK